MLKVNITASRMLGLSPHQTRRHTLPHNSYKLCHTNNLPMLPVAEVGPASEYVLGGVLFMYKLLLLV